MATPEPVGEIEPSETNQTSHGNVEDETEVKVIPKAGKEEFEHESKPPENTEECNQPIKSPSVRFSPSAKGGNSERVEVIEFLDTEMTANDSLDGDSGCCGKFKGPHILFFTVLCIPVAFFASVAVSFYYGAWTWYNLYIYFSEERTMCHKICVCPVLILTFPFTVGFTSLGIAIFAGFFQISWSFFRWKNEFLDFEKGFYGLVCDKIGLQTCAPYEVVLLNEDSELEPMRT